MALVGLHLLKQNPQGPWGKQVKKAIVRLRRERNPFAEAMAHFYEGLLLQLTACSPKDIAEARKHLVIAWEMSKEDRLRPYQLAAEDAIAVIDHGKSAGRLIQRMDHHGIVDSQRFSRLYTI